MHIDLKSFFKMYYKTVNRLVGYDLFPGIADTDIVLILALTS